MDAVRDYYAVSVLRALACDGAKLQYLRLLVMEYLNMVSNIGQSCTWSSQIWEHACAIWCIDYSILCMTKN
jgi:hypothetical protein